ncbi:MAG: heavy-metal-associated domain-containing protein [Desulfuromonadales bacterium]|nr:heavy-metal-associated domain-containing protein [Desulfuromonadales bacterium]
MQRLSSPTEVIGGNVYLKRVSTLLVVFGVVTVLALLALRIRVGVTADAVAVLKTTGMTCGSCSSTITKVLESLKGVAVTEVDVEGGWVVVGYDTKTVKPEVLAKKVNDAGFASAVHLVLTPEQFNKITGRSVGQNTTSSKGCCGKRSGGCGGNKIR